MLFRSIVLMGSAKTMGTDFAQLEEFPDDVTDDQLDKAAWEASIDNAKCMAGATLEVMNSLVTKSTTTLLVVVSLITTGKTTTLKSMTD